MKALVTGASGFIGGSLAEELCRRGYDVTCLVRPTSVIGHLQGLSISYAYGDLRDKASLASAVRERD